MFEDYLLLFDCVVLVGFVGGVGIMFVLVGCV